MKYKKNPVDLKASIELMSSMGFTVSEMVDALGVSDPTIRRYLPKNHKRLRSEFKKHKLSPQLEKEIVEEYLKGKGGSKLAKQFNMSRDVIEPILKKHGVRGKIQRDKKVSLEVQKIIIEAYLLDIGPSQIAKESGLKRHTVTNILRKHGLMKPHPFYAKKS
jgi:DNA invertase Pin-like site-specific DNA recombinase